ncbi:unnamed protein product [Trichobilharzia regenti]|nr:unnamed protein product [Trichobilharzia regenti]
MGILVYLLYKMLVHHQIYLNRQHVSNVWLLLTQKVLPITVHLLTLLFIQMRYQ